MVQLATQVITEELTGTPSPVPNLKESHFHHYGVKEAVFPFKGMGPVTDSVRLTLHGMMQKTVN